MTRNFALLIAMILGSLAISFPGNQPLPFVQSVRAQPPAAGDVEKPSPPRPKDRPAPQLKKRTRSAGEIEEWLSEVKDFEFPGLPLHSMVDRLTETYMLPFILDKKALADSGIDVNETIDVNLRNIGTDQFLDLALGELDLTWLARNGYVLITTNDRLSELLEVRVYNCSDLIELVLRSELTSRRAGPLGTHGFFGGGQRGDIPSPPARTGGGFFAVQDEKDEKDEKDVREKTEANSGAEAQPASKPDAKSTDLVLDYDSLISVIVSNVEPETWSEMGGWGSIESYHGGLLVIRHNGRVHRRIENLLQMLREARAAEPGAVMREE